MDNTGGGGGRGGAGRNCEGGGGKEIKRDYVYVAEEFWQRQLPPTAEEVKSISERPYPHVRDFKKISVLP